MRDRIINLRNNLRDRIRGYNSNELLLTSAKNNDLAGVQQALREGADIIDTALHDAISRGNTEIVKILLANGADIKAKDNNSRTALNYAVLYEHTEIVKILLENGADINSKEDGGYTALYWAVYSGKTEMIKLLLASGADINSIDYRGKTALHVAASNGKTEIVKILLANGADINAKDNEGKTALHWAAYKGNTEIAKLIIANGADINAKDKYRKTSLHWAAYKGNTEIVKILLANGADINSIDNEGGTALHWAALYEHTEIVKLLLANGADFKATDNEGKNTFDYTLYSSTEIGNILSRASDINRLLKENFVQNSQEKTRLIGQINIFLNPIQNETDDAKKKRESSIKSLAGFAACVIFSNYNLKEEFLACFDNETNKLDEEKYTEFFNKRFLGVNLQFKTQLQLNLLAKDVVEKITNAASTGIAVKLEKALGLLTPYIRTTLGPERVDAVVINAIKTGMKRSIVNGAVSGMPLKLTETTPVLPPEIGLIIGSFIPLNSPSLEKLPCVNKNASINARNEREVYLNNVRKILTNLKDPDESRVFLDGSQVIQFIDDQLKSIEEAKKTKEAAPVISNTGAGVGSSSVSQPEISNNNSVIVSGNGGNNNQNMQLLEQEGRPNNSWASSYFATISRCFGK